MLKAGSAARRRSLNFAPPQPPSVMIDLVGTFLQAVDQQLQQSAPLWVGHCKLLVSNGSQTAYASITTADDVVRWTDVLSEPIGSAELTIYAAIYNLTDAQVAAALDQQLALLGGDQSDSAASPRG